MRLLSIPPMFMSFSRLAARGPTSFRLSEYQRPRQALPSSSAVNIPLFRRLNVALRLHNGASSTPTPDHPPWQRSGTTPRQRHRRPGRAKPKFWETTDGQAGRRRRRHRRRAGDRRRAVAVDARQPDYRVLFSNYTDRDGGAITAALDQMGVKYKFSEGGSAILVPADQVHDMRLKLASQGLPRAGNVGFELLENQKLGTSQFVEQVNYQRSLEGELANSIQSLAAVSSARVHLALPKPSVFVRDQQKPTASVLLNLQPGRALDQAQVSAIVHLVASSVPELPPSNVTVVDQNGNLLSDTSQQGRQAARSEPAEVRRGAAAEHRQAGRVDHRARSSARTTCAPRRPPTSTSPRSTPPPRCTSRIRRRNRRRSAASRPRSQTGPGSAEPVRRAGRAVEPAAGRGHRAARRRRRPGRRPAGSDDRPDPQGRDHQLRSRQDRALRAEADGRHQAPDGRRGGQLPPQRSIRRPARSWSSR